MLQSLNIVLSSNSPDESISEELVEMIGYDDIELAMEILSERRSIASEVGPLNICHLLSYTQTLIPDLAIPASLIPPITTGYRFYPTFYK